MIILNFVKTFILENVRVGMVYKYRQGERGLFISVVKLLVY